MRVDQNFMPVVGEEGHVLFDTEPMSPHWRSAFFQDPTWSANGEDGRRKTHGLHTNMLMGGCMPSGFAKEIAAVRLVAPGLKAGTRVPVRLSRACSILVETDLVVGEWRGLSTVDVPHVSGEVIVPGPSAPLLFTSLEHFRFEVGERQCDEARLEVRGTLWRPDFESPLYRTWRAGVILANSRSPGLRRATMTDSGGLFDTELLHGGKARLFADARRFSDGSPKTYAKDTNCFMSAMIPRSHMGCVMAIRVETGFGDLVRGPGRLTLRVNGWPFASRDFTSEGCLAFFPPEPLFLLDAEHYVLEVEAPEQPDGKIKAILEGPYYTSAAG